MNQDELKTLCRKYKINIDSCLQDIDKIKSIVRDSQCINQNEINILKSAEELLTMKGLSQCVK